MPLDPSIFTNYANIRANQNAQLGAQIGNAIENVQRQRMFNQAQELEQKRYDEQMALKREELSKQGLDLDKLIQPIAIKAALYGPESLSQEERAVGKAFDMVNSSKLARDPVTGEMYQPNIPIFGGQQAMPVQAPMGSPVASPAPQGQALEMPKGLDLSTLNPKAQQVATEESVRAQFRREEKAAESERKKANPMEYSDTQLKAAGFGSRMKEAEDIISSLPPEAAKAKTELAGYTEAALSAIPSLGLTDKLGQAVVKMAATPEEQQYLNAAQEWIRAKLRKESGAVIGAQEMIDEYATYFPTAGDTPEVVKQKEKLRAKASETMKKESAGAYELQYKEKPSQPNRAAALEGKRVRDKVTGQMGTFVNGQFVPEGQ